MHRFKQGRPLVLGGVAIEHDFGLDGDSDADVLTHSIIDALLGALSLGDIGSFFGVGTPNVIGARSLNLLKNLCSQIKSEHKHTIVNIDTTIIAQTPKLTTHRSAMIESLANALSIDNSKVSVKFTTAKHMGAIGDSEGIACIAIANLVEINHSGI